MKSILILLLSLVTYECFSQEKREIVVKTEVDEVTVFINGAQVSRKKVLELTPGKVALKFINLSPYLDTKSIQIKASGEIMVLSVNHQFNYQDSSGRSKEIEGLNLKLQSLEDKIKTENANLSVVNEELAFLKDNRIIGGKNQEVSFQNLKGTTDFYRERMTALKIKELEINRNINEYTRQKNSIQSQINQLGSVKITPGSEIIVNLNSKTQGRCEFELTYYVNNAGWLPSYDIRSRSIDEPVELVYKANIRQNTREEWKNVKLKLSSTNPNLGNTAPKLKTYYLNYHTSAPRYNSTTNMLTGRVFDAAANEPLIGASIVIKGTTIGTTTDLEGNFSLALPANASEIQISFVGYETQSYPINSSTLYAGLTPSQVLLDEVVATGYGSERKEVASALAGKMPGIAVANKKKAYTPIPVSQTENQTTVEFEIKTPYTISSDNKNITVEMETYSLPAEYQYYCIPKIDKDAFLIANIVDWEKYNLLEGEANIFFENTFVGKSVLDVRFISDTLTISLGRDKNVLVKREKVKSLTTKQFLGNKKEETRAWQISVKNNKKQAINMLLFDQVPVSTLEEIEVSTDNISGAALDKDKGEVKWNFVLEPLAKKDFELRYRVKYPKEKSLIIE